MEPRTSELSRKVALAYHPRQKDCKFEASLEEETKRTGERELFMPFVSSSCPLSIVLLDDSQRLGLS